MPELVTLAEDGPLGKKGEQVWVDEPKDAEAKPKVTKKATSAKKK